MLRRALLFLSERQGLQTFLRRREVARRIAHRFVAGETLDAAIEVVADLNRRGMKATLDRLGESVTVAEETSRATEAYIRALERLNREGVDSGISIKLTQIGLSIDERLCRSNLRRVAHAARENGRFVRIDMEAAEYVQPTLRLFDELCPEFPNLGVVIQSYLRRSEDDVRELCSQGASVRLCKGAYRASKRIAYRAREEIDSNFRRLLEILIGCDAPLAVATHDSGLIEDARRLRESRPSANSSFEFQMLYGVRRELQQRLVEEGYRVRVYVPYGTEWYPYFMRRVAERPANALLILRALVGR